MEDIEKKSGDLQRLKDLSKDLQGILNVSTVNMTLCASCDYWFIRKHTLHEETKHILWIIKSYYAYEVRFSLLMFCIMCVYWDEK